jgi:phosphatidylglycerophosphate synthase
MSETTGERRPIASREHRIWQRAALVLVRARVSANAISVLGMVTAFAAAMVLILTAYAGPFHGRLLYLAAAGGIQLRLLANMLDGMVAIASKTASTLGELYNEIPDRLSDTAILVAAGYSAGSEPALGWAAAAVALFVTYLRALGNSCGVTKLFQGPMSKSHRMFTLTVACVYLGLAPDSIQPQIVIGNRAFNLMAVTLAIVVLGGIVTAIRRTVRIVRVLKERA